MESRSSNGRSYSNLTKQKQKQKNPKSRHQRKNLSELTGKDATYSLRVKTKLPREYCCSKHLYINYKGIQVHNRNTATVKLTTAQLTLTQWEWLTSIAYSLIQTKTKQRKVWCQAVFQLVKEALNTVSKWLVITTPFVSLWQRGHVLLLYLTTNLSSSSMPGKKATNNKRCS